jgi:hypothetical protein
MGGSILVFITAWNDALYVMQEVLLDIHTRRRKYFSRVAFKSKISGRKPNQNDLAMTKQKDIQQLAVIWPHLEISQVFQSWGKVVDRRQLGCWTPNIKEESIFGRVINLILS